MFNKENFQLWAEKMARSQNHLKTESIYTYDKWRFIQLDGGFFTVEHNSLSNNPWTVNYSTFTHPKHLEGQWRDIQEQLGKLCKHLDPNFERTLLRQQIQHNNQPKEKLHL